MIPTKFLGVTGYLGAPPNWDGEKQGDCDPLPYMYEDGFFVSMWVPDRDELAALNAGQAVVLHVAGVAHPVVSVGVSQQPVIAGAPAPEDKDGAG